MALLKKPVKRIAINTGGGDAPGLNAVIRAVTISALRRGWEVLGIRRGYGNILAGEPCHRMSPTDVRGIAHLGGTILGTTNKGNPFEVQVPHPRTGKNMLSADVIAEGLRKMKLDGVIAIGGDGSLSIAHKLMKNYGIPMIGVPKTIDNDLNATERTFGFDTAVSTATECLDKLHCTAQAHDRIMVVEVMGRHAGWIALHAGLSTSADAILIPEIPFELKKVSNYLIQRKRQGRSYGIVVVAEGALEKGHDLIFAAKKEQGREQRLGGIAQYLAEQLQQTVGLETRSLVLGHIQRGGSPTTYDRLLALRYGAAAVRLAEEGKWGRMVSFRPPLMTSVPLEQAIRERKVVPIDCDTITTARDLGICLGD